MTQSYDEITLTPITNRDSTVNKTGGWRTLRPVIDVEKCIKCWNCWKFCPDMSIIINRGKELPEVDYDYCKGCGICVHECPVDAIVMEKEV